MHLRGEGWKEFKVGTISDIALATATDPQTQEEVEVARGVPMAYRAVLGSAETCIWVGWPTSPPP
jgi:hypothetical protein